MLSKCIVPDIISYTVLINGLCNKGQLENGCKILEDMDRKSMTPRVFIFYFFNNTLIARHFKEGTLQEAFRLLDEMLNRGLVPNKIT